MSPWQSRGGQCKAGDSVYKVGPAKRRLEERAPESATGTMIHCWEYLVRERAYLPEMRPMLSHLGMEGWDLVHADPYYGTWIFKRPYKNYESKTS